MVLKRMFLLILTMKFCILFYYILTYNYTSIKVRGRAIYLENYTNHYYINIPSCRIPFIDPFNRDVIKFYKKMEYFACSDLPPLSYIEKIDDKFYLKINHTIAPSYSDIIHCEYSTVLRIINYETLKVELTYVNESVIYNSVELSPEQNLISVACMDTDDYEIYTNVHSIINPKKISQTHSKTDSQKFSVILFGLDGLSRPNLARTMPKTLECLNKHSFITLNGYQKVGTNTFPNLVPLLTGQNWARFYTYYQPTFNNTDRFEIIWKDFKRNGYVTAYAEDISSYNLFSNDYRIGFRNPPTDFYFKPYYMATEKLDDDSWLCTGPEHRIQRLINNVKDFLINCKNYPKFGFFWGNSLAHENMNWASIYDTLVKEFLQDIHPLLNNTIFIFLSDHGSRGQDYSVTNSGWYEERLPFMYFLMPEKFKKLYPKQYKNLLTNTNRLTNPYDIHMTLQNILKLGNNSFVIKQAKGCKKCKTLFEEIPENRTCEDASIVPRFCLCEGFYQIDVKRPVVTKIAKFGVSQINNILNTHPKGDNCASYVLEYLFSARLTNKTNSPHKGIFDYYHVIFKTYPPAIWDVTVKTTQNESVFALQGKIERIDFYSRRSYCVKGTNITEYCVCHGFINKLKKRLKL